MKHLTLLALSFVVTVGCGCARDPYADLTEKQVKDATKRVRPLSGHKPPMGKPGSKDFFGTEVPPPNGSAPVTIPLGDPPK